jgi:hypothetical protein
MSYNFDLIREQAFCNWCRNPMVMSEEITEANFVDTGKKYPALYCSSCLAIEFRKSQPKTAINPDTLDEIILEDLPDAKEQKAQPQEEQASEQAIKA